MKKILYFFLGCIVFGVGMSVVIGNLPAFEMAGTSFLLNIKQGNYEQAYSIFSPECKQRLPIQNFVNFSIKNQLTTYKEVKWLRTVMSPDKTSGYILGDVIISEKEILPIELQFIKLKKGSLQEEGWFVDDMFVGKEVIIRQSKMTSAPARAAVPPHPLTPGLQPSQELPPAE